jgi:hypothetical protein
MVDATVPDEVEWALPGRMMIEERTAPDRARLDVLVPALISAVRVGREERTQATRLKLRAWTPVAQYAPECQAGVAAVQQVTAAGDQ